MRTENPNAAVEKAPLVDPFGRTVNYVRMSVTDRCDFRCVYCMSENMTFLPKADLLTLEELERVARVFSDRGVRRIRITGGEPLVRRDVMQLMRGLGKLVHEGRLDEWMLTTNASQLGRFAGDLKEAGLKRVNVSLDTRDAEKFSTITRWGRLEQVLAGIEAARDAGIHIKINMVALKGVNDDEIEAMLAWCGDKGFDMCLIETMPIGAVDGGRADTFLSLADVRKQLAKNWTFEDSDYVTPGPARYVRVRETGTRLGFITPLSHNFCEGCNRVRMTCTGRLYMCLGQEDSADLRAPLREDPSNLALHAAITEAISRKPKGHDFVIERDRSAAAVSRHMNVTGG